MILSFDVPRGAAMRTRTPVVQPGNALQLELGLGLLQAQPARQNTLRKLLSTNNRQSSMMMIVHSVSWVAVASQPSASQFSIEWTTTY
jgi:hypothetical protein